MFGLLIWVVILGLIAWVITRIPLPSPFREVVWVILVIILIMVLLNVVPGGPVWV